jgi:hypothetical protein
MIQMKTLSYAGRKQRDNMCAIKFYVDKSYKLPESLTRSDIPQTQAVLDFSGKLLELQDSLSDEYLKNKIYTDQIKTIEDKYSKQVIEAEKVASDNFALRLTGILEGISEKQREYDSSISVIKTEYESRIKELKKELKKADDEATATKSELEDVHKKEIKLLKKQVAEKDAEVQSLSKGDAFIREQCSQESEKMIKIIEEKNKQTLEEIKKSYEQISELKEDALKQRELKISQKEEQMQTAIKRGASSSYRGQDGESYFSDLAKAKMKWELENTSKIPHSCDYSGNIHRIPVLFEVKNHTSDVGQKEVTKFLRDMKEHPEVIVGIFISLNKPIAGKDRDVPISIEWINDSQSAVYIQSFKDLDEDHTLSLIDQLIRLSSTYSRLTATKGYLSQESVLQARIDKARVYIEEYTTESCLLINRVTNDQKVIKKNIENSFLHTLNTIKTQSACINTALEIITGEYKEDIVIDETIILPDADEEKPKPKRSVKKKV